MGYEFFVSGRLSHCIWIVSGADVLCFLKCSNQSIKPLIILSKDKSPILSDVVGILTARGFACDMYQCFNILWIHNR